MKQRNGIVSLVCLLSLCVLMGLLLTACGSKEPVDTNAVTEVSLNDKGELVVRAQLTEGFLESYDRKKVYLFELPSMYSTDADLDELDPVAEMKVKGNMTVKLSAMDGVRSRLFSSFLVASYNETTKSYTPLTSPMALSDPGEAVESAPVELPRKDSIKGLISDYAADAIRLGISHTVVDVPMDKLILSVWEEGAVSYVYNGTTAYLDEQALKELDETVGVYTAAGVRVYLRFRLGSLTEDTKAPLGLYHSATPKADAPADAAVNMSTSFSANTMEGFFDFMAERYAAPTDGSLPVTAFVMGYRVNSKADHDGGEDSMAAFVTNYEKLVRVANVALKSHNPKGQVYISLDYHRSVREMEGGWDVPTFLSAFREEAALRGDYDWQIACELYADNNSVWEEDPVANADFYTVRSLSTLTDILSGDKYRDPLGEDRRVLVSGFSVPAVTVGGDMEDGEAANRQAASYAYAYMVCMQNGHVEALVYSAYADSADSAEHTSLCGLRTVKSVEISGEPCLLPGEARSIYDVFKKVDTTEATSLSTGLNAIIGSSYTKLESALAGTARPVTLVKGQASLSSHESTHKKAAPLYTFGGGTLHGFESAGNLTYLELAYAEPLNTVTLHACFTRLSPSDPMGLTVTIPAANLIGGKELILDLYAGQAGAFGVSAEERPTLTLRLTRPSKGSASEGDGEILYEASVSEVKGSSWQTATFDIAEFVKHLDAEDTVTLTLLMDHHAADSSYNLGLAGVYVTGNTVASKSSKGLVIGIVIAILVIGGGTFGYWFWRKKWGRRP